MRAHVGEFAAVHVHAVFSHASIAAGRASRRAGVPYVVRPLGSIDPWSLSQHPGRKRALMWLGARALLSGATRVHYTADRGTATRRERVAVAAAGRRHSSRRR